MCAENQVSIFDLEELDQEKEMEQIRQDRGEIANNLTAEQISDYANEKHETELDMTPTKSFAWHNLVGSERFYFENIKGYDKLSEYAKQLVRFYIQGDVRIPNSPTFYKKTDGFITAKALAYFMGFRDTRPLRQHNAEIDVKTELAVYSCNYGYKLCANEEDIDNAVEFSLAPALTTLKRAMHKSKNKDLKNKLHAIIGYTHKQLDNKPQGQKQFDIDRDMQLREVNHFVKEKESKK